MKNGENTKNNNDNILFKKDFYLENVRHTPCYTSFLQRIQAKAR